MPFVTVLLGMTMWRLSTVRSLVSSRPISSTVPLWPFRSTKSPTLKGALARISTPLAKLERLSLRARPMATPAVPMAVMREVVGMPRTDRTMMMRKT